MKTVPTEAEAGESQLYLTLFKLDPPASEADKVIVTLLVLQEAEALSAETKGEVLSTFTVLAVLIASKLPALS